MRILQERGTYIRNQRPKAGRQKTEGSLAPTPVVGEVSVIQCNKKRPYAIVHKAACKQPKQE